MGPAADKGGHGRYLMDEGLRGDRRHRQRLDPRLEGRAGDLLFQILFLAVWPRNRANLPCSDVMTEVGDKMIRRHPHVFGDRTVRDVAEIKANWQAIKRDLENKGTGGGILNGIPRSLACAAPGAENDGEGGKGRF